jgi:hypothetical protein
MPWLFLCFSKRMSLPPEKPHSLVRMEVLNTVNGLGVRLHEAVQVHASLSLGQEAVIRVLGKEE